MLTNQTLIDLRYVLVLAMEMGYTLDQGLMTHTEIAVGTRICISFH